MTTNQFFCFNIFSLLQDTEVDFESSAVFENTEANDEQDFVDTASSNNSATSNDHTAETETTESSSNTRKPPFAPVVSASQKPAASANSKRPFTPLKRMDQLKPTGEPAPAAVGTTAAAKRANVPPPFAKRGATTSASGPLSQTGAVAQQHQPPPFAKPQSQKRLGEQLKSGCEVFFAYFPKFLPTESKTANIFL